MRLDALKHVADALPAPVRKFTTGYWPGVWLGVACALVFWSFGGAKLAEARSLREENALKRNLAERRAELVATEDSEKARAAALAAWWSESAPQRVRGQTIELASAELQRRVSEILTSAGVNVSRIERMRTEEIAPRPMTHLVLLNVRLQANTMEAIAEALGAIESAERPWVRIGNATITPSVYRFVEGVQVDTTLYAVVEATNER